mmetsp:Transcript_11836/g.31964  ORF Transcript_11836/g.31964 Transcript_11836/m.31964 type:complete len:165 (+) Transcript_11836:4363-4857(+)
MPRYVIHTDHPIDLASSYYPAYPFDLAGNHVYDSETPAAERKDNEPQPLENVLADMKEMLDYCLYCDPRFYYNYRGETKQACISPYFEDPDQLKPTTIDFSSNQLTFCGVRRVLNQVREWGKAFITKYSIVAIDFRHNLLPELTPEHTKTIEDFTKAMGVKVYV